VRSVEADSTKGVPSILSRAHSFSRGNIRKRFRRFQPLRNHTHRFRINDTAKKAIACSLFPTAVEQEAEEEEEEEGEEEKERKEFLSST